MAGDGDDFTIDKSRLTVNTDGDAEVMQADCDRCGEETHHVLIYAFAPPSDFARWRCEACTSIQTIRGGDAA